MTYGNDAMIGYDRRGEKTKEECLENLREKVEEIGGKNE